MLALDNISQGPITIRTSVLPRKNSSHAVDTMYSLRASHKLLLWHVQGSVLFHPEEQAADPKTDNSVINIEPKYTCK